MDGDSRHLHLCSLLPILQTAHHRVDSPWFLLAASVTLWRGFPSLWAFPSFRRQYFFMEETDTELCCSHRMCFLSIWKIELLWMDQILECTLKCSFPPKMFWIYHIFFHVRAITHTFPVYSLDYGYVYLTTLSFSSHDPFKLFQDLWKKIQGYHGNLLCQWPWNIWLHRGMIFFWVCDCLKMRRGACSLSLFWGS